MTDFLLSIKIIMGLTKVAKPPQYKAQNMMLLASSSHPKHDGAKCTH